MNFKDYNEKKKKIIVIYIYCSFTIYFNTFPNKIFILKTPSVLLNFFTFLYCILKYFVINKF